MQSICLFFFFSFSSVVHGVKLAGFFCQKDGAWKGLLAMAAPGGFLPPVGMVWVCTKPKLLNLPGLWRPAGLRLEADLVPYISGLVLG